MASYRVFFLLAALRAWWQVHPPFGCAGAGVASRGVFGAFGWVLGVCRGGAPARDLIILSRTGIFLVLKFSPHPTGCACFPEGSALASSPGVRPRRTGGASFLNSFPIVAFPRVHDFRIPFDCPSVPAIFPIQRLPLLKSVFAGGPGSCDIVRVAAGCPV